MIFDIVEEPADETYWQLLAKCTEHCASALLVVRRESDLAPSALELLAKLEPNCLRKAKRAEWPGTVMRRFEASVYEYRLDEKVLVLLQTSANGLYQWVSPGMPEDLALLRHDGRPVLVTIAHEQDSYLDMSEREADELMLGVPRLRLARRYVRTDQR